MLAVCCGRALSEALKAAPAGLKAADWAYLLARLIRGGGEVALGSGAAGLGVAALKQLTAVVTATVAVFAALRGIPAGTSAYLQELDARVAEALAALSTEGYSVDSQCVALTIEALANDPAVESLLLELQSHAKEIIPFVEGLSAVGTIQI